MFPIPWNFPFRKKNGDVTTISDVIGGGGGSELPAHTVADAGKVLMVDSANKLVWGTVSSGGNRYSAPKSNVSVDINTVSKGGT